MYGILFAASVARTSSPLSPSWWGHCRQTKSSSTEPSSAVTWPAQKISLLSPPTSATGVSQ